MKKVLLFIALCFTFTSTVFAATPMSITGYWEYVPEERSGMMRIHPECFAFKINETGEYLSGDLTVGNEYYINSPGSNIYHKFHFAGKFCSFSGKLKQADGTWEYYDKGCFIDGVTFGPGMVPHSWGGYSWEEYSENAPNLSNAHLGEYTLEQIPANGVLLIFLKHKIMVEHL